MAIKDQRPAEYRYTDSLKEHLGGDFSRIFNGELIYPRQIEIHLPSNHLKSCAFHCGHCAGKLFEKSLGNWEMQGIELLQALKGKIPYHMYGGAYTEPIMNPYLMTYLNLTKKYNNHFGIHTSGCNFLVLEKELGFLTELNRISTDRIDYISISLDAGTPESWAKTKGSNDSSIFHNIIEAMRLSVEIRNETGKGHSVRFCYLISPFSDTIHDFENITSIIKEIGADSLRFSIPFASYNQPFEKVREYKHNREIPMNDIYQERLKPYLSKSRDEKPYIFYTGYEFTDIDRFTFKKCPYPYFQITCGADGNVYKCSTTASPSMPFSQLGKMTGDLDEFNKLILKNQNPNWDTNICFSHGGRCNRMGLEINTDYEMIMR